MPDVEPIQAFRAVDVPVDLGGDKPVLVRVPFDVELLERVEETARRAAGKPWYLARKKDERILEAYQDFCRPYLPDNFDFRKVQPTFTALFFSHVRSELLRSFAACVASMNSTGG